MSEWVNALIFWYSLFAYYCINLEQNYLVYDEDEDESKLGK
jgi:hypothetical protein